MSVAQDIYTNNCIEELEMPSSFAMCPLEVGCLIEVLPYSREYWIC